MNALDMWLASTLDLPWSLTANAATTAANASSSGDPVLDIELLSELIKAQDASAAVPPAQSTLWPEVTAVLRTTAPAKEHNPLSPIGFLEADSPTSTESEQDCSLFDSLTDLSEIGALTISGATDLTDSLNSSTDSIVAADAKSVPDDGTHHVVDLTVNEVSVKRPSSDTDQFAVDSYEPKSSPASLTGTEADTEESAPLKKRRKTVRRQPPKDTPAYRRRRDQNNQAVRRCRQKTKEKNDENQRVADGLRNENNMLRERLDSLFREVRSLRSMLGLQVVEDTDFISGPLTASTSAPGSTCNNAPGAVNLWQGLGAGLVL